MKINFEKIFFIFILVDILFLPYFNIVSTNYSLPIIFLWSILSFKKIIKEKGYITFFIMFSLSLMSTILSFIIFPKYVNGSEIYIKNINFMIQYTSYILYYMMFQYYFKKYKPNIDKILTYFVYFVFVMCLIYFIDKTFFVNLKIIWNNSDYFSLSYLQNSLYAVFRYNFIWTDPNNVAYGVIAVVFFLISNTKISVVKKWLLYIMQVVIVLSTMSVGGIASIVITSVLYLLLNIKQIISFSNMKEKIIIIFIILITSVVLITNYTKISNNIVYMEAIERIENNTDGSESRFRIWNKIVSNVNIAEYLLIGKGGQTVVNDTLVKPHSGHLLILLSYGLIYYICFIKEYFIFNFKQLKHYLFVIPILIGFTVNTLIGEQKLFIIYILIFLYTKYMYSKTTKDETEDVKY